MTKIIKMFSEDSSKKTLATAIKNLELIPHTDSLRFEKAQEILKILEGFLRSPEFIDKNCQLSISRTGRIFLDSAKELNTSINVSVLDEFLALLYGFVVELDISTRDNQSEVLRQFQGYVEEILEGLTRKAQRQVVYAKRDMPIQIMKRLLGTGEFSNIQNFPEFTNLVDSKIASWNEDLDKHEKKVDALKITLEKYENAFNFVGLYKGFNELWEKKKLELKFLHKLVFLFGFFLLVPLIFDIFYIYSHRDQLDGTKLYSVIAIALISLSMTLLLIYFFRLVVRSVDSCKAQILQIELRKTLCQFIQCYAKYAKDMKKDSPELLTKFENMIFSGLVSSDEKLPSTFDGIEQLTGFVKALKEK